MGKEKQLRDLPVPLPCQTLLWPGHLSGGYLLPAPVQYQCSWPFTGAGQLHLCRKQHFPLL